MTRKYIVAGFATFEGVRKARFSSREGYIDQLIKSGCTDVDMQVLPYPMTKEEAVAHIGGGSVSQVSAPAEPEVQETDEETMDRIAERFAIQDEMTRAVISKDIRAMIVTGPPGVGKSFGVEQELKKYELLDQIAGRNAYYEVVKGAMTAIGLYKKLFDYSEEGKVLVFDDCDSILQDELSLNLLKAALDSGKRRRICWNSESRILAQEGIPNAFDFKGGVIFITNIDFNDVRSKKLAAHLDALSSRCHYLDMGMSTNRECMLRIRQVARDADLFEDYRFNNGEGTEVIDFMEENMDKMNELSLRAALKVADLRKISPQRWKTMAEITCMGKKRRAA